MTISTWVPDAKIIVSITNANPAVVTTSSDHDYVDGLFVRIVLPGNFGVPELNGNVYPIKVLTSDSFSIAANTLHSDPFGLYITTQEPQVSPVGEDALTLANSVHNSLPTFGG